MPNCFTKFQHQNFLFLMLKALVSDIKDKPVPLSQSCCSLLTLLNGCVNSSVVEHQLHAPWILVQFLELDHILRGRLATPVILATENTTYLLVKSEVKKHLDICCYCSEAMSTLFGAHSRIYPRDRKTIPYLMSDVFTCKICTPPQC